jgi:hypothetical protein
MIYNRTIIDLNKSYGIIDKIKNGQTPTASEIETLERGTLTINTLNRIENKQAELSEILYQWRYLKEPLVTKSWTENDFFKAGDMNRLTNNTLALKDAFYVISNEVNPQQYYTHDQFNFIEKTLYEIDTLCEQVGLQFKRSGDVISGQSFSLPM